jgi:hypothetical protein
MNGLIGKVLATSIATKLSKNPTIECIHSSLPKNEKSHFGPQRTLGVKVGEPVSGQRRNVATLTWNMDLIFCTHVRK